MIPEPGQNEPWPRNRSGASLGLAVLGARALYVTSYKPWPYSFAARAGLRLAAVSVASRPRRREPWPFKLADRERKQIKRTMASHDEKTHTLASRLWGLGLYDLIVASYGYGLATLKA